MVFFRFRDVPICVWWLGKPKAVSLLVGAGARVDQPAGDGRAPLHHAAFNGHLECAKQLLKASRPPPALESPSNTEHFFQM